MNTSNCDENMELGKRGQKRPLELEDQPEARAGTSSGAGGDVVAGAGRKKRPAPVEKEDELKLIRSKESMSKVMNNSLIMEKIAKKLSAGHLLNLRQTGSIWNHNFIPQLKKKHPPVLIKEFPNRDGKTRSIRDFMNIAGESHDYDLPFTKYDFQSLGNQEQNESFKDFVTNFGNNITSLSLDPPNLLPNEIRKIIFDLAPTLTELKISYPGLTFASATETSNVPWIPFMNTLPKLKRLDAGGRGPLVELAWNRAFTHLVCDIVYCTTKLEWLKLSDRSRDHSFLGPILTVFVDHSENKLDKLKTLKAPRLQAQDLQKLLQLSRRDRCPLQLEKLSLSTSFNGIEQAEPTPALLHEFLATQSPTLKTLFLNFFSFSDAHVHWRSFHIPPLEHLKFLQIGHRGRTPPKIRFKQNAQVQSQFLSFQDAFPELRQFSYKSGSMMSANVKRFKLFAHSRVEEFKLQSVSTDFVRFARLNSLLTRLDLDFSPQIVQGQVENDVQIDGKRFATIWTTWPNLTVLHLTWKVNGLDLDLDAFLTGVPRSGLELLRLELGSIDSDSTKLELTALTLATLQEKLAIHKIRGGISDLKQLQKLTIIVDGERIPQLTDMGGYFGLAFASAHLQRTIIHGRGKNLVSAQCVSFIKGVFGPTALIEL